MSIVAWLTVSNWGSEWVCESSNMGYQIVYASLHQKWTMKAKIDVVSEWASEWASEGVSESVSDGHALIIENLSFQYGILNSICLHTSKVNYEN